MNKKNSDNINNELTIAEKKCLNWKKVEKHTRSLYHLNHNPITSTQTGARKKASIIKIFD